jgi:hypothetical protein
MQQIIQEERSGKHIQRTEDEQVKPGNVLVMGKLTRLLWSLTAEEHSIGYSKHA